MPDEPDELGNRELTCQLDWIDDETRLDDEECNDFKEYCQTQLIITYPRYVWPLPRDPVIDDFMPGYCCLDTPTSTDFESEFWGQHYDSSQDGMKCQNRGKWHMGMSDECSNGGGQWFRTPCITLYRCIDARPRKDEDGYSESFEEFVVENEIEIYDHTDLEQCQTARAALGFDVDHPNDHEVCEEFNNRLCDLFFRDLDFLAGGADGEEVKFEQIGVITGQEKACEALNDPCDLKQLACEGLQETLTDLEDLACSPFAIVVPTFGQATFGAYYACIVKKKASKIAKRAKCLVALNTCRVKALTCKLSVQLQKKILHAVHVGVKIAHAAVDNAIKILKLPDAQTQEEFDLVEATYHNTMRSHEWNAEALDIVNYNIREQHTQMRSELQVLLLCYEGMIHISSHSSPILTGSAPRYHK
ncbi:hypothetical protein THAOC_36505 [Thalassiosira oceanica]|uniref:Uncharacterized protein n=1 Tax=Thalassiosira oceanica TaxID=159749 RepID=K0R1S4_THAOC|nr:hypothetical protein THAOC_36505 [Thalassiosira oceanica]|eukprot:EJK44919.1 hypothetical protein THAOC_36505 [Thalassiosira oceanica]